MPGVIHWALDPFDKSTETHGKDRLCHTSPIFYAKEQCIYEPHYVHQVSVDRGGPDQIIYTPKITREQPFSELSLVIHIES